SGSMTRSVYSRMGARFVIPAEAWTRLFSVIPAKAGIHLPSVIPAKAGIHLLLTLRENRLTSLCFTSAIHGGRSLSFACPKESNQRKRHPRFSALATRGFATVGRVWPRGHPWPLGQIGAIPRAARVRCTRLFRPPFAASQREPEEQSFCGRDCRALLYPGPSRPRRAGAGNSP